MDYKIIGNKITEVKGQLSQESQEYIKHAPGDLYSNTMDLIFIIEQRFFINESDELDYKLLNVILQLIDMLMELILDDDDSDDTIIMIDDEE